MASRSDLKTELRTAIAGAGEDGTYSEAALGAVHDAIAALEPHTQVPSVAADEQAIAGPWGSLFTQWGPAHTAGKPTEHDATLATLSFNMFPKAAARLLAVEQEVHAGKKAYNNVHILKAPDGSELLLIVEGRYRLDDASPQRMLIDFYRARLTGAEEGAVRRAFGLSADQPLAVDIKPPKLHSDVTFCDEELRINRGSMGGVYVMERLSHGGRSVSF